MEATGKNLNDLKLQNKHANKVAQEQYEAAQDLAEHLKDQIVTVTIKAGEGGRNFRFRFYQRDLCSCEKTAGS